MVVVSSADWVVDEKKMRENRAVVVKKMMIVVVMENSEEVSMREVQSHSGENLTRRQVL